MLDTPGDLADGLWERDVELPLVCWSYLQISLGNAFISLEIESKIAAAASIISFLIYICKAINRIILLNRNNYWKSLGEKH